MLTGCRVAFRAYQVLSQPVDKLVQVLGLEVPVAPLVSLAGIKADGVLLHWKPPDQRASVLKYVIRVNGIDSMSDTPRHNIRTDAPQLATYPHRKLPSLLRIYNPTITIPSASSLSTRPTSRRRASPSDCARCLPIPTNIIAPTRPKTPLPPTTMTAQRPHPLSDRTRASPTWPFHSLPPS